MCSDLMTFKYVAVVSHHSMYSLELVHNADSYLQRAFPVELYRDECGNWFRQSTASIIICM